MVDHHDAGAVQPLGLVHEQVAALVVHVVGDDETLCETDAGVGVNCCPSTAQSINQSSFIHIVPSNSQLLHMFLSRVKT